MIINGSLNYDSHGRRRKTVRKKRRTKQSKWKSLGAVAQQGERRTCTAKVADSISVSSTNAGKGTMPDNSWKLEISKKYTVAPAYNKGAYQVIPREDVEHIGK